MRRRRAPLHRRVRWRTLLLGTAGLALSVTGGVLAAEFTAAGVDQFYADMRNRHAAKEVAAPVPATGPAVESAVYPLNPPAPVVADAERPVLPFIDDSLSVRTPPSEAVAPVPTPTVERAPTLSAWVSPSDPDSARTAAANRGSAAGTRPALPAGFASGAQGESAPQFPTPAAN